MTSTDKYLESGFMDYNNFKKLLDKSNPDHLYEELMKKEERLLQTMNRVVDYSNKKELESKEFVNMPVKDASSNFMLGVIAMINDLTKVKDGQQLMQIVMTTERIIYIGIILVIISMFLFFIQSST